MYVYIYIQLDFSSTGAAHCSDPPCAAITMTSAEGYDVHHLTLPVFMVRLAVSARVENLGYRVMSDESLVGPLL